MYSATQLAARYVKYYLSAANSKGHGIHSPFVFDFIKFIKNDKKVYHEYAPIESLRRQLLCNPALIEVKDFGAGSGFSNAKQRSIQQIAKSSLKPKKFGQLLFRMVKAYKPTTILELGTSFGITTSYLASAASDAQVVTIEGASSIAAVAGQNFSSLGLNNIRQVVGNFDDVLLGELQRLPKIDFVFIDGNHRKLPTLQYFHEILKKSHSDTVFVFDDIHWSDEMEQAWQLVKGHSAVTLSMDLFFIGIVFSKNIFSDKHHYSIRY